MTGISDNFNRPINYLRISVTDRCNLRCIYCMPPEGVKHIPHSDVLSYEEISTVAKAAAEMGINKIRLTGGEPLVRARLTNLVGMLSGIEGIDDLSLTTNGILLDRYAQELKTAGLKRVNVSIDSLLPDRFRQITRLGTLDDTLRGIEVAKEVGLFPIKVNVVVMEGVNEEEIVDFARMTVDEGWNVRFIELMPVGEQNEEGQLGFVPVSDIREQVESLGKLEPCTLDGNGPAKYFRLPQANGTIGFISPVSEHICFRCNRMRLTADGKLRPCLLRDDEIDMRGPLREGASIKDLKSLIRKAILAKPVGHQLNIGATANSRRMSQIGG
ncbi:MAG: GTP 3',8-cyclase MoaA [Dehalococcoidia bacterium]